MPPTNSRGWKTRVRHCVLWLSVLLLPAFSFAQTPAANQQLVDEMKGIRASLARITQLLETLEKSQEATLVLQHILGCESQLRILQMQRSELAAQERDFSARAAALGKAAAMHEGGKTPDGSTVPGGAANSRDHTETREKLAEAKRSLAAVTTKLQSIDRDRAALDSRLEQLRNVLLRGSRQ